MKKRSFFVLAVIGMITPLGCDGGDGPNPGGDSDADTDTDSDSDSDSDGDSDSLECSDLAWGEYGNPAVGDVVQNWPFVGYADVNGDGAMDLDHMVGFSMNRLHCAGYQSAVVVLSSPGCSSCPGWDQQLAGIREQIVAAGGALVATFDSSLGGAYPLAMTQENYDEYFDTNFDPATNGTEGLFMSAFPPAVTEFLPYVPWTIVVNLVDGTLLGSGTGAETTSAVLSLVQSASTGAVIEAVDFIEPPNTDAVWHDPATDLDWEVKATEDTLHWAMARDNCYGLDLGGYTNWRLPSIDELRTLAAGTPATEDGGECPVTDGSSLEDATSSCNPNNKPSLGPGIGGCYWNGQFLGTCARAWSSSQAGLRAWQFDFLTGQIVGEHSYWSGDSRTRCVRRDGDPETDPVGDDFELITCDGTPTTCDDISTDPDLLALNCCAGDVLYYCNEGDTTAASFDCASEGMSCGVAGEESPMPGMMTCI